GGGTTTAGGTGTAAAGEPVMGGILRNAVPVEVPHLNGVRGGTGTSATTHPIYDTFVSRDFSDLEADERVERKLAPSVAESWEPVDPLTYIFKIRQGMTFHD